MHRIHVLRILHVVAIAIGVLPRHIGAFAPGCANDGPVPFELLGKSMLSEVVGKKILLTDATGHLRQARTHLSSALQTLTPLHETLLEGRAGSMDARVHANYDGRGVCPHDVMLMVETECVQMQKEGRFCDHTKMIERFSSGVISTLTHLVITNPSLANVHHDLPNINVGFNDGLVQKVHPSGIFAVDKFLSHDEADTLTNAVDSYGHSRIRAMSFPKNYCEIRTSESAYLPVRASADGMGSDIHDLLSTIQNRISRLVNLPTSHFEAPSLTKYDPGQFYSAHYDTNPCKGDNHRFADGCNAEGRRMITVLVHLSDHGAGSGGATWFPDIEFSARPEKGSAIVFFPSYRDGTLNPFARHAGQTADFTKYVLQQWIHKGPTGNSLSAP